MLTVSNISKSFDKPLFSDFSYEFCKNRLYIIHGDNGTGKSTFLHCLSGAVAVDEGEVRLGDLNTQDIRYKSKISLHQSSIGLFPFLTPLEFIEFHLRSFDEENKMVYLPKYLEKFRLQLEPNKIMDRLSSGMRKKIFLIASLIRSAEYYLIDEPSSYLDNKSKIEFTEIISHLMRTSGIILTTHDSSLIDLIYSRIDKSSVSEIAWPPISSSYPTRS